MRPILRAAVVMSAAGTVLASMVAAAPFAPAEASSAHKAKHRAFVRPLHTVTTVSSTVPDNGDVNPYGVAVVKKSRGDLHKNNVLVSNFNNKQNQQGTGTTIVQISPDGDQDLFAEIDPADLPGPCPGGVGLTTALTVLRSGWVIVGSLPTADGTSDTAQAGCLLVLDSHGTVRETFFGHGLNGPWDMTALDRGDRAQLFVTNVLNGTVDAGGDVVDGGSVVRLGLRIPDNGDPPKLTSVVEIGSGFGERTDPDALVVGPTGVGLAKDGTLFVADTVGNRITAIRNATKRITTAGTGRTISSDENLNGPLGLAISPFGTILTTNGGDGNLVETTRGGKQIAVRQLDASGDPPGAGALFGLAVAPHKRAVYFVDDADNKLKLLHRP